MQLLSIIFIAFALSLDAFSVTITCGIKLRTQEIAKYLKIAITFGLFQAIMPLGGWGLGHLFKKYLDNYTCWISFTVFLFLGLKTFYDNWKSHSTGCPTHCKCDNRLCLLSLAVATSIDAFLVGIVLALYETVPFYISLPLIGVATFAMSIIGCFIGNRANRVLQHRAQILAGVILIGLAVKSLF